MSTEFISFLSPPGSSIADYDRSAPSTAQLEHVPQIFIEAMSIRESVFVHEQGVPLENELDIDDARSYHWVAYASVGSPSTSRDDDEGRTRDGMANRVPVGTIRLVPPPHPEHPVPGTEHQIDNSDKEGEKAVQGAHTHSQTLHSTDEEPYIKLGRLAVLKPYRSLGLSRLLISAALEWASKSGVDKITPAIEPSEAEKLRTEGRDVPTLWDGRVMVHAQKSVQGLWAKNGFVVDEGLGTWDEEGIEHVGMWRTLKVERRRSSLLMRDP